MIRALLKVAAAGAGVLLIAAGALFAFGARIVVDGGGGLHVRFVKSADEQAEEVARHREAQRAQAPPAPEAPAAAISPDLPAPSPGSPAASPDPSPSPLPSSSSWPSFRGPARDGHYRGRVRLDWPAGGLTPMWKQPSGGGYASFVTAKGRAFTIEQRGSQEVAAAYDIATGRELWTSRWDAAFREMMGGDGPRATPTWDAGRVYALGATGELRALDEASGRLLWRVNILQELTEGGDMALVRATPEAHQEIARFPLFDGKTWNHPAISGGILLVRNITGMAAFDLRPR